MSFVLQKSTVFASELQRVCSAGCRQQQMWDQSSLVAYFSMQSQRIVVQFSKTSGSVSPTEPFQHRYSDDGAEAK